MTTPTTTRPEPEPLLDLRGVARRLGVNERHIRRLVAERRIPFIKWGHLIRFDPAEINEWLDACRRWPARRTDPQSEEKMTYSSAERATPRRGRR